MVSEFYKLLEENPVIPGIKDDEGLQAVAANDSKIVFVLYGNVMNVSQIVKQLKDQGKMVFVNVDLIEGFSSKEIVVEYMKHHTEADGVLSSKAAMIRAANAQGLLTIHRLFLIDSFSFRSIEKQIQISQPDCIETLPGAMPKVISWVAEIVSIPIIAGGLVCDKEDVMAALRAGATAISSTNMSVWSM
jgi:glycerol uptake operon antiterminator